jgi:hypothetical protein
LVPAVLPKIGVFILLAVILAVGSIWFFDPFDGCESGWRVTTYEDFSGHVTETCADLQSSP